MSIHARVRYPRQATVDFWLDRERRNLVTNDKSNVLLSPLQDHPEKLQLDSDLFSRKSGFHIGDVQPFFDVSVKI